MATMQAEGPLKVTVYDNKKELIEITFLKDKVFSAGIIRGQPTEIDRILLSIKNISGRDGIQVNHHVEAPLPIGSKILIVDAPPPFNVKATVYYIKTQDIIEIKTETESGLKVYVDAGRERQMQGECLFRTEGNIIPEHCLQTQVYLWLGDKYECIPTHGSFCNSCARIIDKRGLLRCPKHPRRIQDEAKRDDPLNPVMI